MSGGGWRGGRSENERSNDMVGRTGFGQEWINDIDPYRSRITVEAPGVKIVKQPEVSKEVVEIGYHTKEIARGTLGEVSKIREELEELEDALKQSNHIMALVEASDLYGALKAFAEAKGVKITDLEKMAEATKRSFDVGERVTRD